MRITDIREKAFPLSRYADPGLAAAGLTTSAVAIVTDVVREGRPVVGYGFSSMGRFAQSGLIRERFAPRLLKAGEAALLDRTGTNLDPFRAWDVMMAGEKPGGHGERCVAVGTLDMALWDAASKIARTPLYRYLVDYLGMPETVAPQVPVYAAGGYYYPKNDLSQLTNEVSAFRDLGYTRVKIKIGTVGVEKDLERISAVQRVMPGTASVAVDAMNSYNRDESLLAARALAALGLWWFEDICDPLDFETLSLAAAGYKDPIAAGEALFSVAEARLLDRHGGLRKDKDFLVFDPVHCYGLPEYLRILNTLESSGWPRRAFWPHGGHLFCLHVAAGLQLGGAEVNPFSFQPFGGYADSTQISGGMAYLPDAPGIGFESKRSLRELFASLINP